MSSRFSRNGMEKIVEWLKKHGVRAVSYEDFDAEEFRKERFEVAVGVSVSNNNLVRGIDLPDVIRYAIFFDVPHISFPLKFDNSNVQHYLLLALRELIEDERVGKYLTVLHSQRKPNERSPQEISNFLKEQLSDPALLERLKNSEQLSIEEREDGLFIKLADAATHLQASGRTSRMFAGGVSRGVSLVLHWDEKLFNNLKKRLKLFFDETEFIDADQMD